MQLALIKTFIVAYFFRVNCNCKLLMLPIMATSMELFITKISHSMSKLYVQQFCFQAKDMVNLSRTIATKIKDKKGDITEDEVSLIPFSIPVSLSKCLLFVLTFVNNTVCWSVLNVLSAFSPRQCPVITIVCIACQFFMFLLFAFGSP